ncbi:MAG: RnfABCDGE type electron transport complex subunit B [Bacilli bacterium]|nr:RnfABCDGE type electron transport complex subunit B [Bacilli bacterium]
MEILYAFLLLGGLGLFFGIILAICAKIFYVKEDTRVEDVKNMLPNYNCGSCGYPGCVGFAEALVNKEANDPSRCKPCKKEDVQKIKEYLEKN